ncbi:hypothetical protein [uncultured Desulfovibrio sp.]|uniref:hypothetical protein n=1 Tax=uncultured Desulfovibrio sp. TaxID=167968 RepID=UPI00260B21C2|nr:hypothetical protein [uncultured Desulfovibrio sp.]
MSKPLLLIDADVVAYQACAGAEKIICFDDDSCFPQCSLTDAIAAFNYKINFITETLGSQNYLLCFSDEGGNNFRRALYPQYKSNRAGKPRPVALKFLREHFIKAGGSGVVLYPCLEADDVMGILATRPDRPHVTIIVSIDKDLRSVPGVFFNLGRPEDGIQEISIEDADYWFMMQTLMGDATDGYPGCPKFGPATAAKALKGVPKTIKDMWPVVVAAYEKAGFGEDYALLMARMARILRDEDYDFVKQEVNLWVPE